MDPTLPRRTRQISTQDEETKYSKIDRLNIKAIFDKNTCLSMFSRCHLNPFSVRTSPWPLEVFFTYYPGEDKTPWESWQNDFLWTGGNIPPVNLKMCLPFCPSIFCQVQVLVSN